MPALNEPAEPDAAGADVNPLQRDAHRLGRSGRGVAVEDVAQHGRCCTDADRDEERPPPRGEQAGGELRA